MKNQNESEYFSQNDNIYSTSRHFNPVYFFYWMSDVLFKVSLFPIYEIERVHTSTSKYQKQY